MCRVWVVVCVGRVSGLRLVLCVGFGGGVYRVLWWCVGSWLCVCFSVCMRFFWFLSEELIVTIQIDYKVLKTTKYYLFRISKVSFSFTHSDHRSNRKNLNFTEISNFLSTSDLSFFTLLVKN